MAKRKGADYHISNAKRTKQNMTTKGGLLKTSKLYRKHQALVANRFKNQHELHYKDHYINYTCVNNNALEDASATATGGLSGVIVGSSHNTRAGNRIKLHKLNVRGQASCYSHYTSGATGYVAPTELRMIIYMDLAHNKAATPRFANLLDGTAAHGTQAFRNKDELQNLIVLLDTEFCSDQNGFAFSDGTNVIPGIREYKFNHTIDLKGFETVFTDASTTGNNGDIVSGFIGVAVVEKNSNASLRNSLIMNCRTSFEA